jgi:hypothetical protein
MQIKSKNEITVTVTMDEREAKILACLIGALSPMDAEAAVQRALHFNEWVGKLQNREVVELTGELYDSLYNIFDVPWKETQVC